MVFSTNRSIQPRVYVRVVMLVISVFVKNSDAVVSCKRVFVRERQYLRSDGVAINHVLSECDWTLGNLNLFNKS